MRAEIPYREDPAIYFEPLRPLRWPVWLDSGRPADARGRYDIFAAEPWCTLVTRGAQTHIEQHGIFRQSAADPLQLLREALQISACAGTGLPFCGGAIGYFGYELAHRLEGLPVGTCAAVDLPDMAVGLYDRALVVDHATRSAWLIGPNRDAATAALWAQWQARFTALAGACANDSTALTPTGPLRAETDPAAHAAALARIDEYLRAGDCYQVNFALHWQAGAQGDPWPTYRKLRAQSPAPFGAFLQFPFASLLCNSPEHFLRARDGRVKTHPIKGTRGRGHTAAEDTALAAELTASAKDRAENLMIVDLLRNDLGKVCQPGSIRVPRLFELQSFANVHHLASTITGELAAGKDSLDLLRACFPGGSVTGAPKRRAMAIIAELEPVRRGVYCGAIGYVGYDGALDLNIAIRTLVHANERVHLWAGGGIVADSDPAAEYRECLTKAAALMRALGAQTGEKGLGGE